MKDIKDSNGSIKPVCVKLSPPPIESHRKRKKELYSNGIGIKPEFRIVGDGKVNQETPVTITSNGVVNFKSKLKYVPTEDIIKTGFKPFRKDDHRIPTTKEDEASKLQRQYNIIQKYKLGLNDGTKRKAFLKTIVGRTSDCDRKPTIKLLKNRGLTGKYQTEYQKRICSDASTIGPNLFSGVSNRPTSPFAIERTSAKRDYPVIKGSASNKTDAFVYSHANGNYRYTEPLYTPASFRNTLTRENKETYKDICSSIEQLGANSMNYLVNIEDYYDQIDEDKYDTERIMDLTHLNDIQESDSVSAYSMMSIQKTNSSEFKPHLSENDTVVSAVSSWQSADDVAKESSNIGSTDDLSTFLPKSDTGGFLHATSSDKNIPGFKLNLLHNPDAQKAKRPITPEKNKKAVWHDYPLPPVFLDGSGNVHDFEQILRPVTISLGISNSKPYTNSQKNFSRETGKVLVEKMQLENSKHKKSINDNVTVKISRSSVRDTNNHLPPNTMPNTKHGMALARMQARVNNSPGSLIDSAFPGSPSREIAITPKKAPIRVPSVQSNRMQGTSSSTLTVIDID